MSQQMKYLYEFGPFRIDPPERLLVSHGHSIAVTPKAFDVLVILIQRSGHLVEKSQLMEAVWGDSFVEEGLPNTFGWGRFTHNAAAGLGI